MNDEIKEIKINTLGQLLDFVETEEKAKLLIDYITNLQQENERLTNELNTCMIERNNFLSRNKKAVEYIKARNFDEVSIAPFDNDFNCKENLLNILNGRSDE